MLTGLKGIKMKLSINDFLKEYDAGTNNGDDLWYDWFCTEKSLKTRVKGLVPKIRFLINEKLIDGDNNYVWLKNNCPMCGILYDDFRISTLTEGENDSEFLGGVCPKTGHNSVEKKASLWYFSGPQRDLEELEFSNWAEMKKELKTNESLRDTIRAHFSVL